MLSTQQFANLCDTSKRTIHYYDEIGVLKPQYLKGSHRFYSPQQVLIFQKITLLKTLGLSLEEVKVHLHDEKVFASLLDSRHQELERQIVQLQSQLERVKEYQENLKKAHFIVSPTVKQIKPYSIYAIERKGRYIDINRFVKELASLIGDRDYFYTYLTLFKEQHYSPHESSMIIGAVIKKKKVYQFKDVTLKNIKGYKALTYKHIGPYSYLSYIWKVMEKYLKTTLYKIDTGDYFREFYLKGPENGLEENCITELQIPLQ